MIKSTTETLKVITDTIDNHGSCYFTRYGDGDIIQMSGSDLNGKSIKGRAFGGNRTIHTPMLEADLQSTFKITAPNYLKAVSLHWDDEPGMGKGLFESFRYKDTLLKKIAPFSKDRVFLNPIVFHYLITFQPDLFDAFCEKYIKPLKKLYVGCVDPKLLTPIFGKTDYYIKTLETNAVQQSSWVWNETREAVKKFKPDLIIPSCGQTSRSIHGKLWKSGYKGSVIDFGSLVDVFAGKQSRTWIRLKGNDILKRYGY